MSDVLITVENVSKKFCRDLKKSLWYGVKDVAGELAARRSPKEELRPEEFWSVNDVSFELKRGECLGLIGPNGAGKSTLLKMLNGLIKPDRGRISIRGRVGALIELGAGFNPILTGRENIYVNGAVLGFTKREINQNFDEIVDFSEIGNFIDTPVQNYSSGMKVRLGFSVAANMSPDILFIDEVLAVGDLGFRMKCYRHILNLKQRGMSIILVSHSMNDISRVCDRIAVLDSGTISFLGELSLGICKYQEITQLRNDPEDRDEDISGQGFNIKSTRVLSEDLSETENFKTGDDINLEIVLKTASTLRNARLVIEIESAMGPLGSFSTSYSNFSFDLSPTETKLLLKISNIPLLIGTYFISVTLNGPEKGEAYAKKDQVAHFKITGPPTDSFGFGLNHQIKFEHTWTKL